LARLRDGAAIAGTDGINEGRRQRMSGILALLDDIAAIAKLAAAQLDDIAAQAAKAGGKSAGVIIDDAAVTPKYVTGLPAARELPIVAKIARGSMFNKLVILLPVLLALQAFVPWTIAPLLILGGCYLCFEGAEKIWHALTHHKDPGPQKAVTLDAAHLEEQRVKGAIKTDFILSAEIMTIALATIDSDSFWMRAVVLAVVAVLITIVVYGAVALLVKVDDFGLRLSRTGRLSATRAFGRGLVKAMPTVLMVISVIGTAAMLWVGGSIIIHGLAEMQVAWPYETIKQIAYAVTGVDGGLSGILIIILDGIVGFVLGSILMPVIAAVLMPFETLFPEKT
jgi:predicted DNA repair protein MutK